MVKTVVAILETQNIRNVLGKGTLGKNIGNMMNSWSSRNSGNAENTRDAREIRNLETIAAV